MVTLHRGGNWKIAVYGREHGVPHFHVEGPDFRCSISIATLQVLIGDAPAAVLNVACDWARKNRATLTAKWWQLNA